MDSWGRLFFIGCHFLNMKTRPPFVLYNSSRDDLVDFSLFLSSLQSETGGSQRLVWYCAERITFLDLL